MGETRARIIVTDHPTTLSELEWSSRAQDQPGWPTHIGARPGVELVRSSRPRSFGLLLIGMLPDLAMGCRYGDLEGQLTIVKPWGSMLILVLSVAPRRS